MKQEMIKSARADFKPKLSAGGNFNYTGNPLELSIDLPSMSSPLYFQGKDLKYGATLSLSQPIYTGGGIRANYQKARKEKELASNESNRIKSNTLHDANSLEPNRSYNLFFHLLSYNLNKVQEMYM